MRSYGSRPRIGASPPNSPITGGWAIIKGVWGIGYQVESIVFPALYTFLALQWGTPGWLVIAGIGVAAAALAHPAARAAGRHLERVGAPIGV